MNNCITRKDIARTVSLPERPKPSWTAPNDEAGDTLEPQHVARSLSVSFAPAPLDRAVPVPDGSGVPVVELDVASISAVARNFGVLAKRYQDAKLDERRVAFQLLAMSGSRMFADFIVRDAERELDGQYGTWSLKSFRIGDLKAQAQKPRRDCMLGELALISAKLGTGARKVYNKAERRRALLLSEMQQLVECVAEQHGLKHTPELQGILVGCILDGAKHALASCVANIFDDNYTRIHGSVLALCNAVEDTWSVRPVRPKVDDDDALSRRVVPAGISADRVMVWRDVLTNRPEHMIERCARSVSVSPKVFWSDALKLDAFQSMLARTRAEGYGRGDEPQI